jgi:ubiquinone biosynthesis accessory factor UbiJ
MLPDSFHLPVIKFFNRVLSDYPAARLRLAAHQGKLVAAEVGPVATRMRITAAGEMELVGGTAQIADVSFIVPLALLPSLATQDASAFAKIDFTGDSELAATLSDIARNVEWDVEADLSRVVGDVAAHRIVDTAQRADSWRRDAGQRLTENVAEYLTEERRAFIASRDIESFAQQNETLRDDIARLDARLARLR